MNLQLVFLWVIAVPLFRLDVLLEVVGGVDPRGPQCHNVVVTRSNERRFSEKVLESMYKIVIYVHRIFR